MYYCRFADLLTDGDLAELSIPFSADRRIIMPGSFSCEIEVSNETIASRVRQIVPQRTICHVYRNDMIIGSYIIWARQYDGSDGKVKASIQGATLESYLYRRILHADLTYAGVDQISIATDLIDAAQESVGGYISQSTLGITVGGDGSSGILRDRTYLASDGKYIGDLLENLSNVDAGFEYAIQTWDDGASRYREIRFGYDRLRGSESTFLLQEPGDIESWRILHDGTRGNTAFYARGAAGTEAGASQEPTMQGPVIADDFVSNGWPILEYVADYQNASEVDTLSQYAAWWAVNRSGPVTIPSFSVRASSMFNHGFSPLSLGANVTVIMNNPVFPLLNGSPTYESDSRIIGFQLKVDEHETEKMDLILESDFDPTDIQ